VRTWEDNRAAINQLWPQCKWTDEERRLLSDDLSGLDQDVLYDALRNVKRSRDSLYPQLPWMLQSYRELFSAKRSAMKATTSKAEPRLMSDVSDEQDKRLASEFVSFIDASQPSDFEMIETMVLDKLPKMLNATAYRVLMYARKRLLGQEPLFGKVLSNGDVQPIKFGANA
jgi:hypothetical protein